MLVFTAQISVPQADGLAISYIKLGVQLIAQDPHACSQDIP